MVPFSGSARDPVPSVPGAQTPASQQRSEPVVPGWSHASLKMRRGARKHPLRYAWAGLDFAIAPGLAFLEVD